MGINEFLCTLQNLGVKKDEFSGELLKLSSKMWRHMVP